MALGLVRSTVELLTCGRGITPVRGFHQLTCPLLYRLALMLVFGLCVWKWTSSVTTLDPNSPRASNTFNQVVEAKRFECVFLCRKVC